MVKKDSVLKILYDERFLWTRENPKVMKLTEKKRKKFVDLAKTFIKDKIVLEKLERAIEDFIMDFSEVEEIQKFDCYKMGYLDSCRIKDELQESKKSTQKRIDYSELNKTLDELFEARVEKVAILTAEDMKNLKKIKMKINFNETFNDISEDLKEKIEKYIEIVTENMSLENGYFNKKYYKFGASDLLKTFLGLLNYNGEDDVNEHEIPIELQD